MKDLTNEAFISLFRQAFQKCYGFPLAEVLSETESKHFSNAILDQTGLVIGAKSIKNYSAYIINGPVSKPENPSIATLDTFARYVQDAPYTTESERKDKEGHYPWWYQYKNSYVSTGPVKKLSPVKRSRRVPAIISLVALLTLATFLVRQMLPSKPSKNIVEEFNSLEDDTLAKHGWFVKAKDPLWWARRAELPGHLTLFTLQGDNWPDTVHQPVIKNLLLRQLPADCFTAELHLDNFMPRQNWQQAGILLMEDTTFSAPTVRLSIAFNNFFGGYNKPNEIIIQGVSSDGKNLNHPEEIAHIPIFTVDTAQQVLVNNNLQKSGLRIEKVNNRFRFLYSSGPVNNFAFKEAFSKELPIKPKYIGLFALQGFVSDSNYIPAQFSFFSSTAMPCEK